MEESKEEGYLGQLFTDVDYKAITFEYKEFRQKLFALKTSATDYDLTGQIIWKAADIFSKFIVDHLGESKLSGKIVLELGSGPGLCGLVAQHYASKVVLSDYQDLVMDLLAINMRDCEPRSEGCQLLQAKLDWLKADSYDSVPCLDSQLAQVCTIGELKFDYAIGSDIVYWTSSIQPLITMLNTLFERNKDSLKEFYFCYIERAVATHNMLKEGMTAGGLHFEEIEKDFVKSIDKDAYIYKVTKLLNSS